MTRSHQTTGAVVVGVGGGAAPGPELGVLLGLAPALALPVGPPWLPLGAPVVDEPGPPGTIRRRGFSAAGDDGKNDRTDGERLREHQGACHSAHPYACARVAAVSVTSSIAHGEMLARDAEHLFEHRSAEQRGRLLFFGRGSSSSSAWRRTRTAGSAQWSAATRSRRRSEASPVIASASPAARRVAVSMAGPGAPRAAPATSRTGGSRRRHGRSG